MLSNCCSLLTDFRTVFVFALEPFLPMLVIFFDFNENFNAKMANIHLLAIKSSRGVLQPSMTVELHFYSSFQGYPTCYYWSHMARWPDGYKWPFWPSGLPSLKSQTLLNKNHPNELLSKLNILLSPIERRCSTCRWPLLTIGMFPLHLCPPPRPAPTVWNLPFKNAHIDTGSFTSDSPTLCSTLTFWQKKVLEPKYDAMVQLLNVESLQFKETFWENFHHHQQYLNA